MPFFFIPDKIEVTVNLGDATLKVVDRILDELAFRKEVKSLMEDLNTSTDDLKKTVDQNPDPNPTE